MSVKDKVVDKLKDQDQFGYPIMMNVRADTSFNTVPGGFVSLILNAFLIWLSVTSLIVMFTHGNDTIMSNETLTNFN